MKSIIDYYIKLKEILKKVRKKHYVLIISVLLLFSSLVYAYNSNKINIDRRAKKVIPPKLEIGSIKSSISDLEKFGNTSGIKSFRKKIQTNIGTNKVGESSTSKSNKDNNDTLENELTDASSEKSEGLTDGINYSDDNTSDIISGSISDVISSVISTQISSQISNFVSPVLSFNISHQLSSWFLSDAISGDISGAISGNVSGNVSSSLSALIDNGTVKLNNYVGFTSDYSDELMQDLMQYLDEEIE